MIVIDIDWYEHDYIFGHILQTFSCNLFSWFNMKIVKKYNPDIPQLKVMSSDVILTP